MKRLQVLPCCVWGPDVAAFLFGWWNLHKAWQGVSTKVTWVKESCIATLLIWLLGSYLDEDHRVSRGICSIAFIRIVGGARGGPGSELLPPPTCVGGSMGQVN